MADKEYVTVVGFIQFDPNERTLDDGREVRDVTVRAAGSQQNVRITFWDQFEKVELNKGDFIAVDGSATTREVEGVVYYNVSATRVFTGTPEVQAERETTTKKSTTRAKKAPF